MLQQVEGPTVVTVNSLQINLVSMVGCAYTCIVLYWHNDLATQAYKEPQSRQEPTSDKPAPTQWLQVSTDKKVATSNALEVWAPRRHGSPPPPSTPVTHVPGVTYVILHCTHKYLLNSVINREWTGAA